MCVSTERGRRSDSSSGERSRSRSTEKKRRHKKHKRDHDHSQCSLCGGANRVLSSLSILDVFILLAGDSSKDELRTKHKRYVH